MGRYVRKVDRAPYGPLAKHGGYSVAHKDELLKRHPEIQRYLKVVRRGLIRDICPEGEEHLTMARRLVLDRLMGKLATVRLIETYLAEHGILRRDKLELKVLDAEPITTLWMSLNHQIRQDLELLGLDRKPLELTVLSTEEMIEAVNEERAAARVTGAEKRPESDCEGKTPEGGTEPRTDSDNALEGESIDKGDKDNGR